MSVTCHNHSQLRHFAQYQQCQYLFVGLVHWQEMHGCCARGLQQCLKNVGSCFPSRTIQWHPTGVDEYSFTEDSVHQHTHITGYTDKQIQKLGLWCSDNFKECIWNELASYPRGTSKDMKQQFKIMKIATATSPVFTQQP